MPNIRITGISRTVEEGFFASFRQQESNGRLTRIKVRKHIQTPGRGQLARTGSSSLVFQIGLVAVNRPIPCRSSVTFVPTLPC